MPLLFYLFNEPIEFIVYYFFSISLNKKFIDLIYQYTIIGTFDDLISYLTTNYNQIINIDYTELVNKFVDIAKNNFNDKFYSLF